MSWHEPYIALAISFIWMGSGLGYYFATSKSRGKEILLTSKPASQGT